MYGGPPPAWNGGPPAPYGGPPAGNGVMLYGAPQYGAAPPYPEAVPYAPGPAYGAAAGPPAYCAPFAGGDPYSNGAQVDPYANRGAEGPPYSQPPPMAPMGPPPTGRKRALLCACNYFNTRHQLGGCINDAKCLHYLLTHKLGFQEENIRMLTDDQAPGFHPTRRHMWEQIQWLVQGAQPGDSLFFSFSGHGSTCPDKLGEEDENETILPCDHESAGQIVDNDLNEWMVNPLGPGVRLHAVIDACHSGSALDLEFRCKIKHGVPTWKNEYGPGRLRSYKGTAGGLAIQFAAAGDKETAADTSALSGTGTPTGAATFTFIQAIERHGGNISYGQLLVDMNEILNPGGDGYGRYVGKAAKYATMFGGGLVGAMLQTGMSVAGLRGGQGQTPMISSNYAFDMNTPLQI